MIADTCCWLRARGAYGRELDEESWTTGNSSVEGYWCLRTLEPVGPDDRLVHAHRCRASRTCFELAPARRVSEGASQDTKNSDSTGS